MKFIGGKCILWGKYNNLILKTDDIRVNVFPTNEKTYNPCVSVDLYHERLVILENVMFLKVRNLLKNMEVFVDGEFINVDMRSSNIKAQYICGIGKYVKGLHFSIPEDIFYRSSKV